MPNLKTIIGAVTESHVRNVSKVAGKRVPIAYLSVAVERTDPPELKKQLRGVESFRASLPSKFADLQLPVGARVEITTRAESSDAEDDDGPEPFDIHDLKTLP